MLRKIVCLMSVTAFLCACPTGFAQDMDQKAYMEDVGVTQEQMEQFQRSFVERIAEIQQDAQHRIMERVAEEMENGKTPTPEMGIRFAMEEMMLPMGEFYQSELNSHFSAGQIEKMELRNFQVYRGIMDGIEKTDDPTVIAAASQFGAMQLIQGYPDFLELTAAQKEDLQKISVENMTETSTLTQESMMKFIQENPEKFKELTEAGQKMMESDSMEEQQEIAKGLQSLVADIYGDKIPELKKLIVENNKKFMSVMTDTQKAKIQKVMDDVPEYIWKTFPQNRDKDRPWRPGLDSWMPGMGVPGSASANREARPARKEGRKSFPGQDEDEEE